jgi:hypothetical protein
MFLDLNCPFLFVCLSPRLQRGYNSVSRAIFQLWEYQLRLSSVQFSARLRGSCASQIRENFHYAVGYNRGQTTQFTNDPTRPPSESACNVTKADSGWVQYVELTFCSRSLHLSLTGFVPTSLSLNRPATSLPPIVTAY